MIEASVTPNPECLRFFSMELSFLPPGTAMDLPNEGHAYKSPLAEQLFTLDGIKALYFADEYITVTKEETADWGSLKPMVSEMIINFAETGQDIIAADQAGSLTQDGEDTEPQPEDDDVVLAIKELLASRIRPMVRADGGNVRYVGIDDGTVYVTMEGACKTCPSSSVTLKSGIERMLMHWIPEVAEVLEVDDDFAWDFKRRQQEAKEEAKKASEEHAASKEEKPMDGPNGKHAAT